MNNKIVIGVGLVALIGLLWCIIPKSREDVLQDMNADLEAMHQQAVEQLEQSVNSPQRNDGQDGPDLAVEQEVAPLNQKIEILKQASDQLEGVEQAVLVAQAKTLETLQSPMKRYFSSQKAFLGAGGIDPQSFRLPTDIAARQKLLSAFSEANTLWDQTYAALLGELKQNLSKQGVGLAEQQTICTTFNKGQQIERMRTMRKLDHDLIAQFNQVLELLDYGWGKWRYSAVRKQVVFKDGKRLKAYADALDEIDRLIAEQNTTKKQYLAHLKDL